MKTLRSLIAIILIAAVCIYISFKKDKEDGITTKALVVFTGDLAVDGCGWLIKIDDNTEGYYHPDKLADNLKVDSLSVKITYSHTKQKFNCGFISAGGGLPVIHISSIVASD